MFFWHQFAFLETHPPQGVHMRWCLRRMFIRVGGRGWGGSANLSKALVAGVGRYDSHEKRWVFVCFFSLIWRGGWVYGCMCVCTHTHRHTARGIFRFELRDQDETLRLKGPEEPWWTKSRHTCICKCVQSTYGYMHAGRWDEILE